MSTRVEPELLHELRKYGAVATEKCFNCGNCTASCPLTSSEHPFPRNMIRLVQVGLKDRLLESSDPWLCYYCGDCSVTCPKEAEPAETMMALRRWLTAQYDSSGHAARFYASERSVMLAIVRIVLVTLGFFALYFLLGFGEVVTEEVALNRFAPVMLIWAFVLLHFLYLGVRMFRNTLRMYQLIMRPALEQIQIPLSIYLSEFKEFVVQFFTQRRWRDCDEKEHRHWLDHLLLVSGYVIMLVLIVGLLWWFQTDYLYPIYHPQRWLGYYATVVLIYGAIRILAGRRRKQDQIHRFSQPTDWLFPAFILTGAVTGILVHAFRYAGWHWPTYILYVIHVAAMIAMLDTEVGVGKWAHLIYRPLAIYLERVKERARQQALDEAAAPAPV